MTAAIETRDLTRRFGGFTAVDGISFSVPPGTIFGLLGANGAGKSTTIRMLCGLLRPTSGRAGVAGFDIDHDADAIKRRIGYMSQEFSLYEDLTVGENIRFFGGVYGLRGRALEERLSWTVEMAGLRGRENEPTASLSGGWRQRLALGCAILHEPPVLFLDEPTGGVDPVSRRQFWNLINDLADSGVTVLVTTHYLDEAEYCNDICLMHAGRIVAQGTPAALKRDTIAHPVWSVATSDAPGTAEVLAPLPEVLETSIFGNSVHLVCTAPEERVPPLVESACNGAGIACGAVERTEPSPEDVFIHVIESMKAGEP